MLDLPMNVRQEIVDLVPASILQNLCCFSFINSYLKQNYLAEIVICTTNGEFIEFYQRKPVQTIFLDRLQSAKNITIYKKEDELHYLVSTVEELIILTRRTTIKLTKVIQNLRDYKLEDAICSGNAKIKVWYKGDAMPVILDDKFNIESDLTSPELFDICEDEELPALAKHKCKLIEAKYVVSQSKKNLSDIKELRKQVTYAQYSKMYPQFKDVIFKRALKEVIGVLRKCVERIGIKLYNKKIIVLHTVYNDSNELLTDLEVILHCKDKSVLEYTTKLYNLDSITPYWKEKNKSMISPNEKVTLVTILDIKELENSPSNKIEIEGIILYKINDNVRLLPIDSIVVTQMYIMDEKSDVLYLNAFDETDLLSVLASSIKTTLVLTEYLENEQCSEPVSNVLCQYLGMVRVNEESNMVIHRSSPYHPLNGVMVVCEDKSSNEEKKNITVYSRYQSQVMALLHFIYDVVPYRIVVTLPGMVVCKKSETLQVEREKKIVQFGTSLREQMTLILKYYDDCILKMGQSSKENVLKMLGNKIDLLIDGNNNFELFVNKLKEEILKGFDFLNGCVVENDLLDVMIIDD